MAFGARLTAAMRDRGPLCVGIDPHPELLARWGLRDTPESLIAFSDAILDASVGSAAAVKPNSAFFERHGSRGIAALGTLRSLWLTLFTSSKQAEGLRRGT